MNAEERNSLLYTLEKLEAGVRILATHPGQVRWRLYAAFTEALCMVNAEVLPPDARSLWEEVWAAVTSARSTHEHVSTLALSLRGKRLATLAGYARKIYTVYAMTSSYARAYEQQLQGVSMVHVVEDEA